MPRPPLSLLLLLAAVVPALAQAPGPSPNCLGCICEASSGCNQTIGCSSHAGYHCGPFLISWNFWKEVEQPVLRQGDNPDRKGAFEECANDLHCAADTVALYLKKFPQDCDGDGRISCLDHAMVHKLGGYSCATPQPVPQQPYFAALQQCLDVFNEN